MTLEQEQFQRYRPDFSRLIPYGFEATEEGYRISRDLMNGDFRADITVHTDGSVTGQVMDTHWRLSALWLQRYLVFCISTFTKNAARSASVRQVNQMKS